MSCVLVRIGIEPYNICNATAVLIHVFLWGYTSDNQSGFDLDN